MRGGTLAGRMFAILLVATLVIQVLSFGGTMAISAKALRGQMYHFLAADIAFVHRFLAGQPAAERSQWKASLVRGMYTVDLVERADLPPDIQHPELDALMRQVQQALQEQEAAQPPGSERPPRAQLVWTDAGPAIAVPLDARQALFVQLPPRPPFSPPSLPVIGGYVALVTLGVLLAVRVAVRLATRPLQQVTEASQRLAANLDAPPLPEAGMAEVRQASRAFNAMQAALRRELQQRTRMLASISHDLKTPLTRLRLRLAGLLPSTEREAAEQDIDAMQALIQEGLDYARSEHVQEARVPIDLHALVDALVERAEDMGHCVALHGRLPGPVVCAPRATERALQNLLDNALKYGRDVSVTLQPLAHGAECGAQIRIEDRGPGIAEQDLERVFEPFYRVESSRSRATGGTGLGLAIARNLLQGQGGSLRLANREGAGLVATVELGQSLAQPHRWPMGPV